jgi:phage/plasmid-like protein (TIGR03299 family)
MGQLTVALRDKQDRPWMGLPGASVSNDSSVLEAMDTAGMLRWDVRKRLIETDAITDSDDFEIIRDTERGVHRLGLAGERYQTVQNEELATMADAITDGDISVDVVGHYNKGRNVFVTLALGESIILDGEGQADEIGKFLTIRSSHNGSTAVQAIIHNFRLACQNQLPGLRAAGLASFTMRHTSTVQGRIADARTALGIAFKQYDVFEAEMQALLEREMTKDKFFDLVESIYPTPKDDVRGSVKKHETKVETLASIWNGETVAGLEDTAYKAYNVLNEHLLWYPGIRAGNTENALVRASGFNETTNKENVLLYKRVLASVS